MTQKAADFAIIGATPMARLIAGLLVANHGKSVIFVGDSQSGYRLPRGTDLSAAPMTRPESWALLKQVAPETLKLIRKIGGRATWSRVDPIVFAETETGQESLGHFSHMARAFGHAAEPVAGSRIGAGRTGIVLRNTILLHRPALEVALDQWLDGLAIPRLDHSAALSLEADGRATISTGGTTYFAQQTVLADDRAMLHHLPYWPALLTRRRASTVLAEPTQRIVARVMHQLDSGLTLVQQQGRGITALGPGQIDAFSTRLKVLLGHDRKFRQAGQVSYDTIVTSDKAPAAGRLGASGPDVLAGFGPTGAFLAPSIARWLAGVATDAENDWLAARLVTRDAASRVVAEIGSQ